MQVNRVRLGACFILILCTSCNGKVLELANTTNPNSPDVTKTVYYLDNKKPSITQPIEPRDEVQEGRKFVQVEIAEVQNAKKYALTFEVHYRLNREEKIYLGSFSLYPSDKPGKFIVPTKGKLKNEGSIVLSLVIPDNFDSRDTIKVGVKRIKFLKE